MYRPLIPSIRPLAAGATGLLSVLVWADVSTVGHDEFGGRSVQITNGECRLRVVRHREPVFKVQVESGDCDPLAGRLQDDLARALSLLIDSAPGSDRRLTLSVYLPHQPTALRAWAGAIKRSAAWKNRPPPKNPWDTSEYPLVRKLMFESGMFDGYRMLLARHGYRYTAVHIEKVAYPRVSSLRRRGFDPGSLGYAENETLPVPLMIWLRFER